MKRETFIISLNGEIIGKTFAFNSASRFVEKYIGDVAKDQRSTYRKASATIQHNKLGTRAISGTRQWVGDDGNVADFLIEREDIHRARMLSELAELDSAYI